MTDEDEDWSPYAGLIDERSIIPLFGFQVLSYLDPDGQPSVDFAFAGHQVTGSQALGVILGSAFEMFHNHLHEAGDDDLEAP